MNIFKRFLDFWRRKTWPGDKYAKWKGVKVGVGCRILSVEFAEPRLISIGDNVTISVRVAMLTHDGAAWLFRDDKGRRFDYRRIEVGNNCFIGSDCIILPGVRLGDNVIVGAGSVVTKSIPSGWVVGGNPAKFICEYVDLQRWALQTLPSLDCFDGVIDDSSISLNFRDEWRPELTR